ncbi:DNA-binding protein [Noviherbaspirillum aerium]|uniref:DNA-binding protein n=1 Tax=Noviherbaspirillum aerium TaxID=2588497 RepID=UPI00124DAB43|nr:DNA-binding protein [Noviherbaspirillum aerium]
MLHRTKTTIHKYLRELQEEEGVDRKSSISEVLQDLVERLAGQLQAETNEKLEAATAKHQEQARGQGELIATLQAEVAAVNERLAQTNQALAQEQAAHAATREAFQDLTVTHRAAEQRIVGLEERLYENEQHRQSLEQKHEHARQSLEHYRNSVKEQREQDQRRHEQQVQQLQAEMRQLQQSLVVRQEEVTRLNQEGVRLVSDLSHSRKSLHDEQTNSRQLAQRLESLQDAEQRARVLEVQLAEKTVLSDRLTEQLAAAAAQAEAFSRQVRELELSLATTQARMEAQQALNEELRSYLKQQQKRTEKDEGK